MHIVEGGLILSVVAPFRIVGSVLRGVPAAVRQIDASAEGKTVVNHHQFLVMAGPDGMACIHFEFESFMGTPTELEDRQGLAVQRVKHGEVPIEHIDMQIRMLFCQIVEKVAKRRLILPVAAQPDAAVYVPADNKDAVAGFFQGIRQGTEIGGSIDQHCGPVGPADAPAVPPFFKQLVRSHK